MCLHMVIDCKLTSLGRRLFQSCNKSSSCSEFELSYLCIRIKLTICILFSYQVVNHFHCNICSQHLTETTRNLCTKSRNVNIVILRILIVVITSFGIHVCFLHKYLGNVLYIIWFVF